MTINNVKGSQTNNHVTGDQTNNYVTGNQTHVEVTWQPSASTGNINRTAFILLLLELHGLIKLLSRGTKKGGTLTSAEKRVKTNWDLTLFVEGVK